MRPSTSLLALLLPLAYASHQQPRQRHHHHGAAKRNYELEHRGEGNGTVHDLEKRESFSGRGTFFYVGLGACGQHSSDGDMMVALNSAQYGGGYPGPNCFRYITIQANGVTVGGVQILDECPTCDWGGLDLSPGLFRHFASESAGTIALTWWFDGEGPCSPTTQAPTSTWVAPTSTWTPSPSTTAYTPSSTTSDAWTSSSSTWVASSSTTSTWSDSSSSTSTISTSSASSSTSASLSASTSSLNSTSAIPFAVVSSYSQSSSSTTSASSSESTTASASGTPVSTDQQAPVDTHGNLELLNGLVTNYGQIVVVAAGGYA